MKEPRRWVVNMVEGLPTYVTGRVALLGDAVSIFRHTRRVTQCMIACRHTL